MPTVTRRWAPYDGCILPCDALDLLGSVEIRPWSRPKGFMRGYYEGGPGSPPQLGRASVPIVLDRCGHSLPGREARRRAGSRSVWRQPFHLAIIQQNKPEQQTTASNTVAPVDISNPAIRRRAKTGHRASAQAGCVVARSLLREQERF